jgi:hypothetical protein
VRQSKPKGQLALRQRDKLIGQDYSS